MFPFYRDRGVAVVSVALSDESRKKECLTNATYSTYALNRQESKSCSLFQYPTQNASNHQSTREVVKGLERGKVHRQRGDVHRARQDITG